VDVNFFVSFEFVEEFNRYVDSVLLFPVLDGASFSASRLRFLKSKHSRASHEQSGIYNTGEVMFKYVFLHLLRICVENTNGPFESIHIVFEYGGFQDFHKSFQASLLPLQSNVDGEEQPNHRNLVSPT